MSPQAAQESATTAAADPQDGEVVLEGLFAGYPDGPVTFTRPGIEGDDGSLTVQVKDGKVSTTKARRDWLLTHVVGTGPVAE